MADKSKSKEAEELRVLCAQPVNVVSLLLLAGLILIAFWTKSLDGLELKYYDARLNLASQHHTPSRDIVVVAIDDESLRRMEPSVGRWPWPRVVYAGLIDYLSAANSISFDVLFPEADWQFSESDDLFVEAVLQQGSVVLGAFLEKASRDRIRPIAQSAPVSSEMFKQAGDSVDILLPYAPLRKSARALGHVNIFPDPDGVVRAYPMQTKLNGMVFPSLGLSSLMSSDGSTTQAPDLDDEGFFLMQPYRSQHQAISAVEILSAWQTESVGDVPAIDRSVFEGKHVLVGSLATGLQQDRRVTPWGSNVPGIFIAATALNNALDGIQVRRASRSVNLFMLVLLSVLPVILPSGTPFRQSAGGFLLLIVFLSANSALFVYGQLWIDAVLPSVALVLAATLMGMIRWYHELGRRKYLESLEVAKQEFTDMLVHDLKGRSSSILMASSMFKDYTEEVDETLQTLLTSMHVSAQRLVADTSGLLDIRKMSDGKMRIRREEFSAAEFLHSLVVQNEGSAQMASTHIREECQEELDIRGDIDLLARVISNLIWNAIQHSGRDSEILISAHTHGEETWVDVHNEGAVIEPHRVDDLFIPFLSGATLNIQPGHRRSGMGLTFCKLAVEAHGGRVEVISPSPVLSSGVCFRIVLPVA